MRPYPDEGGGGYNLWLFGLLFSGRHHRPQAYVFFNNDAIERIFFIGLQDQEELSYQEMLSSIGELTVKDGQIVPVDTEADTEE